MNDEKFNLCELLIPYITGECTLQQQTMFEKHLKSCSSCQEEYQQIHPIWSAIPMQIEEENVPSDLKEEVMNTIFHASPINKVQSLASSIKQNLQTWGFRYTAIAVLLIVIIFLWNDQYFHSFNSKKNTQLNQPAHIVEQFSLISFDSTMTNAYGSAWITRQGNKNELIVKLNGLTQTEGTQAYQVWLIDHGKRHNCGTFKVDPQGQGMLVYNMQSNSLSFDAIGITLEPDANGNHPRGKKVLGTNL